MSIQTLRRLHSALAAVLAVLLIFVAVLIAPGWVMIQPRDISTDGKTLTFVRTVTLGTWAEWGTEVERLSDGQMFCPDDGYKYYEVRGYSPVRVSLGCREPLDPGVYLVRACWSPYVLGIPLRATCLQDDFIVAEPAPPHG